MPSLSLTISWSLPKFMSIELVISCEFLTSLSHQATSLHQWAESPSSEKSTGCQPPLGCTVSSGPPGMRCGHLGPQSSENSARIRMGTLCWELRQDLGEGHLGPQLWALGTVSKIRSLFLELGSHPPLRTSR